MGMLNVTAKSEDTIAAPGNRSNNYIEISVSDDAGKPVTGLTKANFAVDAMIVGPGGALVNIVNVTAGRLPGFYHMDVVPIGSETWKQGVYIFAVAVKAPTGQGQTLARVKMD